MPIEGYTMTMQAEQVGSTQANVDNKTNQYIGMLRVSSYEYRNISICAKVVTDSSTAPGADKTLKVYFGFCFEELSVPSDAPTVLSTCESYFVCALPNSANATRYYHTEKETQLYPVAPYLYIWYDCDNLDEAVSLDVYVIRQ